MTRLNAETAEAAAPDAAPRASGPGPGTPGRVGAVARQSAAWREGGRPKPRQARSTGRRSPVEDKKHCLSSRVGAEQASNTARGTPEGPADLRFFLPECLDAARCRGPWV